MSKLPEQRGALSEKQIVIIVGPTEGGPQGWSRKQGDMPNTHWPRSEFPATIEPQKALACSKTIIRRQAVVNAMWKPVSSLKEPRAPARSLKSELNTTPRTTITPNFIFPVTALAHLNALRPRRNGDPRTAKGIPRLLRATWRGST